MNFYHETCVYLCPEHDITNSIPLPKKLNVLQALGVNIYCEASDHILGIPVISVHFQATKGYTCNAYDVAFDDVAFDDVAFDDVTFDDVTFDFV